MYGKLESCQKFIRAFNAKITDHIEGHFKKSVKKRRRVRGRGMVFVCLRTAASDMLM